jgi:superfamily II DNA helicase RecQ
MSRFGLRARAVNSSITKEEHQKLELGTDIWHEVDKNFSIIFVSPEMLTTPGFGCLIDSKVFQKRLFAIGVDEAHLLCSCDLQFRPAFKEIGFIRSRFRSEVVLFGMTWPQF